MKHTDDQDEFTDGVIAACAILFIVCIVVAVLGGYQ